MRKMSENTVALIGAGPSGILVLKAFDFLRQKGVQVPNIKCFEKQSKPGGLWNYDEKTGVDESTNSKVHGSMYRFLWSNGPKECLELGDYTFLEAFGRPIPSFPPRTVLEKYITGVLDKYDLWKSIQFHCNVEYVNYDSNGKKFLVTVCNTVTKEKETSEFDYVIVATGHFSDSTLPDQVDGLSSFPGEVIHSHDFRDARNYIGQNVLIVGGRYSAEDIASQLYKYGANSVSCSVRSKGMDFKWPDEIKIYPLIDAIDGNKVTFIDKRSVIVDSIIFCTGYKLSYSFLPDELQIKGKNPLYPKGLYKNCVWIDNPKLIYMGMQDHYYAYNMFDVFATFVADYITGKYELPSKKKMIENANYWTDREQKLTNDHEEIDFQTDYIKDVANLVNYPHPVDCADMFHEWEHHKDEDIMTYRDRSFKSIHTGVKSPIHHTPWVKAMDDSIESFMNQKGA